MAYYRYNNTDDIFYNTNYILQYNQLNHKWGYIQIELISRAALLTTLTDNFGILLI